jgi:hypothetical protein
MFDPSQIRKYAESIFTNHRFTDRATQRMKCPIHQGKDTNFAFNMDRGVWTCHSRCGSGGLIQLEQRLNPGITREQATERLFQLVGLVPSIRGKQIVCSYDYVDASGNLIFQKLRLEPKDFSFRTPVGRKGYAYTSDVPLRPLYGLPGVITANCLLVTEGEKDADNLNSINEWPSGSMGRIYATTSGAAGTWLPHHGPFCAGKRVVVFEDNDEKGRASVEKIVDSARLYAHSIKIVRFSEFEEKMDVTHFLETQGLPALLEKIKNTPFWKPVETEEKSTIVEGISFANSGSAETNWLIEGVIQAEGNGIIMGDPKAGKSLSATDLIINLISGTPWHRCRVPERVKVGLVTREDAPGLTKKRIQRLISGKSLSNLDLEGWLWVNSREQTKSFNILNDADFSALVRDFKKQNCRIVFFDVFNRIHQLDENDNTMMAQVTGKLSQFGVEVGCQVALIHHINKDNGNLKIFNRLRGAGALHGWMEWGMAITTVNPEDEPKEIIRRIDFESKEVTVDPIHFRIIDGPGFTRLESEMYAPQRRPTIGSTDYKRRSTGERIQ